MFFVSFTHNIYSLVYVTMKRGMSAGFHKIVNYDLYKMQVLGYKQEQRGVTRNEHILT